MNKIIFPLNPPMPGAAVADLQYASTLSGPQSYPRQRRRRAARALDGADAAFSTIGDAAAHVNPVTVPAKISRNSAEARRSLRWAEQGFGLFSTALVWNAPL
jgi:hypothetical protein